GRDVPLLSMVDLDTGAAATEIRRTNRQTSLVIKANLAGDATTPDARKAIEQTLNAVAFPPGYGFTFEGSSFQNDAAAVKQMMFILIMALMMVYVVMAAVCESLVFPSAFISCVVFWFFGVVWLFWLSGTSFSVMAFLGILVLMGVVVNNGIV